MSNNARQNYIAALTNTQIDNTFDAASDVHKSFIVTSTNVTRMHPSLVIQCFSCLLLGIKITHEHVPAIHTNLFEKATTVSTVVLGVHFVLLKCYCIVNSSDGSQTEVMAACFITLSYTE